MRNIEISMFFEKKPENGPFQIPRILRLAKMTPESFRRDSKTPFGAVGKKRLGNGLKNARRYQQRSVRYVWQVYKTRQRIENRFQYWQVCERRPASSSSFHFGFKFQSPSVCDMRSSRLITQICKLIRFPNIRKKHSVFRIHSFSLLSSYPTTPSRKLDAYAVRRGETDKPTLTLRSDDAARRGCD